MQQEASKAECLPPAAVRFEITEISKQCGNIYNNTVAFVGSRCVWFDGKHIYCMPIGGTQIYDITENALNALGITNGASHSEYKITEDGDIYVIEIGGRMGGDFIGSDLVRLSTGYDFVKGVIEVALGIFNEPKLTESNHSGVYFLSKETEYLLPYFANANSIEGVLIYEQTDTELRNITCSADRSGYVIYQAENKK